MERGMLFGSFFNGVEHRYRVFNPHDKNIIVRTGLHRAEFAQGVKRLPKTVLVDADDDVPVLHASPPSENRSEKAAMAPRSRSNATIDESSNEIDAAVASRNAGRPMRVFVGVKVAPAIACELARLARDLEQFSVRLVATGDIHLTLVPPWNEASICDATEKIRRTVDRFCGFTLTLRHLGFGPNSERPRLLWAECAATSELATLRAALLQACGKTDERPFRPHVTLARLRENGYAIAFRCPINREISFTQQVDSVELFGSPPPGGVGYEILASLRFGARANSASMA